MASMLCRLCNKEIGPISNRLPHLRADHPEQFASEMEAGGRRLKAANQARHELAEERKKAKRRAAGDDGRSSPDKPPKAIPPLSTATVPAPGAIVFTLGQRKIEIDPRDLVECWMLCMDIKRTLGLKDEFTTILRDCVNIAYRQGMAQVVVFEGGVSVVKTEPRHNGSGDSEEMLDG